jgi:hypothetical protein
VSKPLRNKYELEVLEAEDSFGAERLVNDFRFDQ